MSMGALSILFESAPGAILGRDLLIERYRADIAILSAAGLLRETSRASDALCTSCGTPHRLDVRWSEERGAWGQFCADGGGWTETSTDSLRRLAFDHIQFLVALAQSLNIKRAPEPLVEGACWRLGTASADDAEHVIIVAREMNDPRRFVEVAAALKRRVKAGPGLILCGATPVVDLGLFPRRFKTVVFDDVIALHERCEIVVDRNAMAIALGLNRRKRGEHGAPHDHPGLVALIEERARTGEGCQRSADEADWLLAHLSWRQVGRDLPEREALRRFISRRRTKSN
ncbi:MAG: hypothetical protein R3C30_15035 [Hyphomonadaceae bacterium]